MPPLWKVRGCRRLEFHTPVKPVMGPNSTMVEGSSRPQPKCKEPQLQELAQPRRADHDRECEEQKGHAGATGDKTNSHRLAKIEEAVG